MLDMQIDINQHPAIAALLDVFAKKHKSEFPIVAVSHKFDKSQVHFYDSRLPEKDTSSYPDSSVYIVDLSYYDGSYILQGSGIKGRRNATRTKNAAAALRLLRKYVKPYSAMGLVNRTDGFGVDSHILWVAEPRRALTSMASLKPAVLLAEIESLKAQGVRFHTPEFRELAEKAAALGAEAAARAAIRLTKFHLCINPDESVSVTLDSKQQRTYRSIEEAPEVIQQNVALLRFAESRSFVPEVGERVRDNLFWVLAPEDTLAI